MHAELFFAILSPDIFPIISSHLPLYAQPSSLLAVALTNREFRDLVIPRLLYQQVTLMGENHTSKVISAVKAQGLATHTIDQDSELPLGHYIRRLDISSELSKEARMQNTDVVTQLREVIRLGYLPNLTSLTLHLREGWYFDENFERVKGVGRVDSSFWSSVRSTCPRLKEVGLSGASDSRDDRWLEDSGLFEFQGLESFRLDYSRHEIGILDESPPTISLYKLFDNLTGFSPNLHTLALSLYNDEYVSVTKEHGLFTRCFPCLQILILREFQVDHLEVALKFWASHPRLERIELSHYEGQLFDMSLTGQFPHLRVLKASFDDLLVLVPVLRDQLVNLTVTGSVNAQVPYLLRSVIPEGLPSLRSLGIHQTSSSNTRLPAAQWREDEDGNFGETSKRKARRAINAEYIVSLARGAPNVEELELVGECQLPIEDIGTALSGFPHLRRLYFYGANDATVRPFIPSNIERNFLEDAREIALRCPSLESIIEITGASRIHTRAIIHRNEDDGVTIIKSLGCGRVVGLEDEAYPGALI